MSRPPRAAQPSRKADPLVPRVATPGQTLARLGPLLGLIPVTRIADLTPLCPDGPPVFCAVTPLARDLTTHLGKGLTPAAARVSALMEAVERHGAEQPPMPLRRASLTGMRAEGLSVDDPRGHDLPGDSRFAPDAELTWCRGADLATGAETWIAADLVISPPQEGVVLQADTNGLASGNSWQEAVAHALCEVIERDAASLALFADLHADAAEAPPPRRIDLATLPPRCAAPLELLQTGGREVILHDLTADIAVPVVRATLLDPAYPGPDGPELRAFLGYGCDPDAALSVIRALTEAAQARVAVVQGARDSFNDRPAGTSRRARLAVLDGLSPGPGQPFATLPSFVSADLDADIGFLTAALSAAGFGRILVADLTHPAIGLPVVRIRVPGLSSFVMDRSRVGARCLRLLT
jgi:ribosomal protein S12 methylthiotransferase accessory factor